MTENENHDQEPQEADVANAPPEVTSPLASFVKGLGGGKKNAPATNTPAPPSLAKGSAVAKTTVKPAANTAPGKPGKPMPIAGPLVTIVTRNEFYRDGFRNLIKIALLEGVVIIGLILTLIVYMNNAVPSDRYFATTADGRIMQRQPLDQPNLDTPALLSWVATAVGETMSFSYLNYQRELQNASKSFTKTGWESFTSALQKSHILDSVQSLQQIVTTTPRSAPVLTQQGVLNGKYRWILKMPIAVKYQGVKETRTDNLDLQLVVERVPSLENPSGVGIAQWLAIARN